MIAALVLSAALFCTAPYEYCMTGCPELGAYRVDVLTTPDAALARAMSLTRLQRDAGVVIMPRADVFAPWLVIYRVKAGETTDGAYMASEAPDEALARTYAEMYRAVHDDALVIETSNPGTPWLVVHGRVPCPGGE